MATADAAEDEPLSVDDVAEAIADVMDANEAALEVWEAFRGSPACTRGSLVGTVDGCIDTAATERRRLSMIMYRLYEPEEPPESVRPDCWEAVRRELR